ncbi:MAG: CRISPR-associated endonuclease Cas2 [Candidatus Sumerlaeia bacterium]|nr:CRISPR-associated endonuclease Cas2 [Candidatus Sumerlaeia bacterium]
MRQKPANAENSSAPRRPARPKCAKPVLSEYRTMWLIAMFDLPVKEVQDRKHYQQFHKALVRQGFMMLQYSVYARFFASEEGTASYRKAIRAVLPPKGQVRLLAITDKQFAKMEVFEGKTPAEPEKQPEQLMLF